MRIKLPRLRESKALVRTLEMRAIAKMFLSANLVCFFFLDLNLRTRAYLRRTFLQLGPGPFPPSKDLRDVERGKVVKRILEKGGHQPERRILQGHANTKGGKETRDKRFTSCQEGRRGKSGMRKRGNRMKREREF